MSAGSEGTMRAAVVGNDRRIGLQQVPVPACGPGMIRVAVDACGLCGSDLHFHHAKSWSPGLIPGHEITGRIEAIGEGPPPLVAERGLEIGRRVVVEPLVSCGTCEFCAAGRDSICPTLALAGVSRPGGFAESVVLPALRIHPVADDLDPKVAALDSETEGASGDQRTARSLPAVRRPKERADIEGSVGSYPLFVGDRRSDEASTGDRITDGTETESRRSGDRNSKDLWSGDRRST